MIFFPSPLSLHVQVKHPNFGGFSKPITMTDKETAALAALHRIYTENGDAMKRLADLEAWEAYCEASRDLSNQDDVSEEQEVDEYGYPLKLGDFYVS